MPTSSCKMRDETKNEGRKTEDEGRKTEDESATLVPLSARSPEALTTVAADLRLFLADATNVSLHEIAANAAERRTHHMHRLAVVVHTKRRTVEALASFVEGTSAAVSAMGRVTAGQSPASLSFCSGQGPQWWGMGRQLLENEPVFRDAIERCDAIVRRLGPWSLLEELTADEARSRMAGPPSRSPASSPPGRAYAAVWDSWGVRPTPFIGHQRRRGAAAYLAGTFRPG